MNYTLKLTQSAGALVGVSLRLLSPSILNSSLIGGIPLALTLNSLGSCDPMTSAHKGGECVSYVSAHKGEACWYVLKNSLAKVCLFVDSLQTVA